MTRNAAASAAALLLLAACERPPAPPSGPPFAVTGTYSDMRTHEETGDVLGAHVSIAGAPTGELRAIVVYAEGTPGPAVAAPVTYEATAECHRVTFEAGAPYAMHFTGCLGEGALTGRFRFSNGTEQRVHLKRHRK